MKMKAKRQFIESTCFTPFSCSHTTGFLSFTTDALPGATPYLVLLIIVNQS